MSIEPPATEPQRFDLQGPLPEGMTVLEASAGTGKTFTIAALAARFVADGLPLDKLLIVTFTRLATSELRKRVRDRLVFTEGQLTRVAAGAEPEHADEVVELLARGTDQQVRERRDRLAAAIANFDAVTIETTHGFCQKMLDGLGTLSENDPGVTFVEDVDDLVTEVIDDLYVRAFLNGRPDVWDPDREQDRDRPPPVSRTEAGRVAEAAIENPLAPIHPADPPQGSALAVRSGFAGWARHELEARKRAGGLMTHTDQLTRLRDTLTGSSGAAAIARLRDSYSVVLIDEFQDTDPIQWDIVRLAFAGGGTRLVLIGDPKQAIYAFRGADVYAYLDAARHAGARKTLGVNHRSDQPLLDGLDALFGNAGLGHAEIGYRRTSAAPWHRQPRLHGAPVREALRLRIVSDGEPAISRTGAAGFLQAGSARSFIAADLAADVVGLLSSSAEIETRDRDGRTTAMTPVRPGDVAVLVRRHSQARLVQQALEACGVPAVIAGSGSVFATPSAADWLALLEALERPSDSARARAAALTPLIGTSVAELADATEADLDALHRRLHVWSRTLREHGFAALSESILSGGGLAARLLTQTGGERRLTDVTHIAELVDAAAGDGGGGIAALTTWLRERIAESQSEGVNDERTRRLDTDADAVQVVTLHGSKGLEFPIVYCPFMSDLPWTPPEVRPVLFHDGTVRAIDVGLEGAEYSAHAQQHKREERGEDLRLLYVALTRARHQVIVWWASTWDSCDSPLGRLLFARRAGGEVAWKGGKRLREADARARLAEVAAAAPHAVAVESAIPARSGSWSPELEADGELGRARFMRSLDLTWRRTSYTALTAAAHESLATSEPSETGVTDEPSGPAATIASELPLSAMAAGPQLGTVIHQTLQDVAFDAPELTATLTAQLTAATRHNSELLGCSPELAAAGLAQALATPLGGELGSLALTGVAQADRLDELAFELPLAGGDEPVPAARVGDIAALLAEFATGDDPLAGYAQRLSDPALAAVLRGYLTGSIDLVLRLPGEAGRDRYAIVDYKTNWLAPAGEPLAASHYRLAALAAEMQRSHYVLQGLLYAVALHRYLRWRLHDHDPAADLAGIHYLFLRGMLGPERGTGGVFAWRPPAQLIVALSDLLAGDRGR